MKDRIGKRLHFSQVVTWTPECIQSDPAYKWANLLHVHKNKHTHTHAHRHTHTHTHTLKQARPSRRSPHSAYLWGVYLSWTFLGSTNQTTEESQEHDLHLGILVALLLEKLRASQLLERLWIGCTFYRIRLLSEYMMIRQWSVTPCGYIDVIFPHPGWQLSFFRGFLWIL